MCRIFLSYKNKNTKQLMLNFLSLSERENCNDGYGISWLDKKKWKTYKQPINYLEDPIFSKELENIHSNIVVGHIRFIEQKEMTKKQYDDEKVLGNTHPFQYENNIFMQHGDLFFENNNKLLLYQSQHDKPAFKKQLSKVMERMDNSIYKKRTGETDTEFIMFLFLSIQREFSNNEKTRALSGEQFLLKCFCTVLKLLEINELENSSNFIYGNEEYILVSRIYSNRSGKYIKQLDLYIDSNDGITICSSKITEHAELVERNGIIIINIKTGVWKVYRCQS
jgi:predicted glutamine amidotransferase